MKGFQIRLASYMFFMKINISNNLLKDFSAIFLCTISLWSPAIFSTTHQFENTFKYKNLFWLNNFGKYFAQTHCLLKPDLNTEAVAHRCYVKKVFLEISQNSQENTCARVYMSFYQTNKVFLAFINIIDDITIKRYHDIMLLNIDWLAYF